MHAALPRLGADFPPVKRGQLTTLQVNLGYLCNQSCVHCHVNAGPNRKERMTRETVEQVIEFIASSAVTTLDLTGGAPELNANFRYLVEAARSLDVRVMDRCNLTVLTEPGQETLAEFLAGYQVEVVASLPCYSEANVTQQRGKGVFSRSIKGLRMLNQLGYGKPGSGLILSLVYNPQGPVLPPPQANLEDEYRRVLRQEHGVEFTQLFSLVNLPVGRFGSVLISKGQFDGYVKLLKNAHQPANLRALMCRSLVSVDWRGYTYDCDFNQMLGLGLRRNGSSRIHLTELKGVDLTNAPITARSHCFGCTAGQGSSCGGALS
ncbi:MAG: radical SAM/Cys-rich domain protein [Gammaproteobacteria bacterium]|nr:radical SAM/Cys-rich domain protein [Gammaproteobacteria bacterium]